VSPAGGSLHFFNPLPTEGEGKGEGDYTVGGSDRWSYEKDKSKLDVREMTA